MDALTALGRAAAVAVALTVVGCYAHESAYVRADAAPVDVAVYPRTYYEGRVVYLIDDRWYTRDHDHWVYYRVEPEPLYRYRVHVQSAPPAHRPPPPRHAHEHHHEYREGHRVREAPPAYVAPPAHRDDRPTEAP